MVETMIDHFTRLLKSLFASGPRSGPLPGLHHFRVENGESKNRVHLRVDRDGHGTLLVNANRMLHLNPTATLIAHDYLSGLGEENTIRALTADYQVGYNEAVRDYRNLAEDISSFLNGRGKPFYALSPLEVDRPFSHRPQAPYRMDLALTYRCNNDCPHCYNARERDFPEMDSGDWKTVLDRLWSLNIPHVVFTGGEPTLRQDLPELISYAEGLGQITGLNTNARRLADPAYVETLVEAGLDHLQITLESHRPAVHDRMVNLKGAWKQTTSGLINALNSPLFVMTNTTMLTDNYQELENTLDYLAEIGVPTIGLNALIYAGRGKDVGTGLEERELLPLLEVAKTKTDAAGQRLIWYTPTLYCNFNPLEMDLGVKGCTAALYNMCVEPNGQLLPCQSYYQPLGHILEDPWDALWNHPLAVSIRERKYAPQVCSDCSLLVECGGGCPLALPESTGAANPENLIPSSI